MAPNHSCVQSCHMAWKREAKQQTEQQTKPQTKQQTKPQTKQQAKEKAKQQAKQHLKDALRLGSTRHGSAHHDFLCFPGNPTVPDEAAAGRRPTERCLRPFGP